MFKGFRTRGWGTCGSEPLFQHQQIAVTVVSRVEFRKGFHSSGPLSIFWLLALLCEIVSFRSFVIRRFTQVRSSTFLHTSPNSDQSDDKMHVVWTSCRVSTWKMRLLLFITRILDSWLCSLPVSLSPIKPSLKTGDELDTADWMRNHLCWARIKQDPSFSRTR